MYKKLKRCFLIITLTLLTYATQSSAADPRDPYENFNRSMFTFNDTIDVYGLKPAANIYNKVMPTPFNQGIHNFFSNLATLPTIANDLLQFNFYQAANDSWRFAVNSTLGLLGFIDVASRIDLKPYSNDFGLTLVSWGYVDSNYLVLPFFGPSSIRDAVSIPVDYFAFSVYPYVRPWYARFGLYSVNVIDKRAQLLKFDTLVDEAALDKYVFVRDAYRQRRKHQIEQNKHLSAREQIHAASTYVASPSAS